MKHYITTPITDYDLTKVKAGDTVILSGKILTGRDAAHKRLIELLDKDGYLPINIKNQAIYYTGPCPNKPGEVIGSCGPTTSYRMDSMTPPLLDLGLKIMIGKGMRNQDVVDAMKRNNAIYLSATGGAGALLANCVKEAKVIMFEDLLSEAIRQLTIEDMPLICAIDASATACTNRGETMKIQQISQQPWI